MSELESLSDSECVKLLQANQLGRIALVDRAGHPELFPVNYFFDEGIVVFRTDPGTKLDLAPGAQVAFEVDGWEADTSAGWSVVVKGICHEMSDPADPRARRIKFWPVRPAVAGAKEHWIGIWANQITGRRLKARPEPA
jgi:uncharacterized protein